MIQSYDRASVTLTLNLPSPTPMRNSTPGAQAFATLDAGAVSDVTPAATLRLATVDPTLLASTTDANADVSPSTLGQPQLGRAPLHRHC